MSKKLNASEAFQIGMRVVEMLTPLRQHMEVLIAVETKCRLWRLEPEAVKVAALNRTMVPVAKPGEVSDAEAEEAGEKVWKGQVDA